MAIEKIYEVMCDNCGAVEHLHGGTDRDARMSMKRRGWVFVNVYEIYCPDCKEKHGKTSNS